MCSINKKELTLRDIKLQIPVFIYGTLRKNGKFDYFLDEQEFIGDYKFFNFELMQMAGGDVHIKEASADDFVIGELYNVSLSSLLRIDHLENGSGSFPKEYELCLYIHDRHSTSNIKDFFYYRLKKEEKISSGDIMKLNSPNYFKLFKALRERKLALNDNEIVSDTTIIHWAKLYNTNNWKEVLSKIKDASALT